MSTTPHRARPTMHPALPAQTPLADSPTLATLEVRWRVARRALGPHAPVGTARLIELAVRLERLDAGAAATARLFATDPASGQTSIIETFERADAEVIHDIREQVHIECPGVLHATISPGDTPGSWRLIYARTPLLDALGIPGGRAEPVGVGAA